MATLSELTVQVLAARLTKKEMSLEELQKEMVTISQMIKAIDEGTPQEPVTEAPVEESKPQLTIKQAFKKDEIVCMVCGKGKFKTLKKHLSVAHQLTPGQYRKQFGIKSTQKLAAKSFSDARRQAAKDRGMIDILAKARETRMANIEANKNAIPVLKAKAKAPVPAVRQKASVPVATKKANVPEKVAKQKGKK